MKMKLKMKNRSHALREKYPYLEFFLSVFLGIRAAYGEKLRISPFFVGCGKMRARKTANKDTFYTVIYTI